MNGVYDDAAISIANQVGASAPWENGLMFGAYAHPWAFSSNSTLIGAQVQQYGAGVGTTPVALNGVDFRNVLFSSGGYAFASPGFNVSSAGKVGIGTTSPYAKLSIHALNGETNTTLFAIASSTASATTTLFDVTNTGNATLAGSLTQNSDERLKTNIQPLDVSSSLAAIEALDPVSFTWREGMFGDNTNLGFIAQGVRKVFPELVATTAPTKLTPGGTLGLNYSGLIAPIVGAIKALAADVSALEKTIAGFALSFTSESGHFSKELCVGSTCVTPDQFQAIVSAAEQGSSGSAAPAGETATDTPSCMLAADPGQVAAGDQTVLSWTATNADIFSIDQGVGSVSPALAGTTKSKSIDADTTFTGTATSPTGKVTTCTTAVSVMVDSGAASSSAPSDATGSTTPTTSTDTASTTQPSPDATTGTASTTEATSSPRAEQESAGSTPIIEATSTTPSDSPPAATNTASTTPS